MAQKLYDMAQGFLEALATAGVRAAREANGLGGLWESIDVDRPGDRFSPAEAAFIAKRDSFYLATVSQTGWPCIQHRGGPPGFLGVLDDRTLGFADFRGNRQYLTLDALADEDRVALFLMDHPRRRRRKILARMTPHDLTAEPDLAARLATPGYRAAAERVLKRVRLELLAAHRAALHDSRSCDGDGAALRPPGRTRGGKRPLARGTGAPCR